MPTTFRALVIALCLLPGGVSAHAQAPFAADQKGFVAYHYCMMNAAMKASHTDAGADDIFGIARAQCAATRAAVVVGQEGNRAFLAALDAADQEKAANFPNWIKGVRERRAARARDMTAAPNP